MKSPLHKNSQGQLNICGSWAVPPLHMPYAFLHLYLHLYNKTVNLSKHFPDFYELHEQTNWTQGGVTGTQVITDMSEAQVRQPVACECHLKWGWSWRPIGDWAFILQDLTLAPGRLCWNWTELEDTWPVSTAELITCLLVRRSLHTFWCAQIVGCGSLCCESRVKHSLSFLYPQLKVGTKELIS